MIEKVRKTIKEYAMLRRGQKAVCGVSGGPDSMALLTCLHQLGKEAGFSVIAAHLDHAIRTGSGKDAELVKSYCMKLGVPFFYERVDVANAAREQGIGIEEAGRQERYGFFNRLLRKEKADRIAVGHTMDDNAETVLMNLMRGSGTAGLRGIRPVQGNIIRPLLFIEKKEILEYLKENGIPYAIDETNLSLDYTRNRVRNVLLPAMQQFNPGICATLSRCAKSISDDEGLLQLLTDAFYDTCAKNTETGIALEIAQLKRAHPALGKRVVREAAARLACLKDLVSANVDDVLGLLGSRAGSIIDLPAGLVARRGFSRIELSRDAGTGQNYGEIALNIPGLTQAPGFGCAFCAEVLEDVPADLKSHAKDTEYFDFDVLPKDAVIRARREGDRIRPLGCGGMKLKKYLSERRVERWNRDKIPLVASGPEVIWAVGLGISDKAKVTSGTCRFLKISYIKNESGQEK
ncbi:MAG: tRNA lysidine(34) synthetase TilS [Bacillota bacterium]|nr:tRNA lysidine(34) synthetase TilS [Bacillota bacterium]